MSCWVRLNLGRDEMFSLPVVVNSSWLVFSPPGRVLFCCIVGNLVRLFPHFLLVRPVFSLMFLKCIAKYNFYNAYVKGKCPNDERKFIRVGGYKVNISRNGFRHGSETINDFTRLPRLARSLYLCVCPPRQHGFTRRKWLFLHVLRHLWGI